jgi:membrane fusion protein
MTQTLFRREALLSGHIASVGPGVFHQPFSVRALCSLLIALMLAFLFFAASASIKETEQVRGQLSSVEGAVKVYPRASGLLQEVLVEEGTLVRRGQPLAIVADTAVTAQGQISHTLVLEQLDAQATHVRAQMQILDLTAAGQQQQLLERIDALVRQIALMDSQQFVIDQRAALSEQDYRRAEALFLRGLLADVGHDQKLDAWWAARQASGNHRLQGEERRAALAEARQQLVQVPLGQQKELSAMRSSLAQLAARRQELETQGLFSITAPQDGRISNLFSVSGQHIVPGVPFLTIIPVDAQLEAQLFVPSRAVGDIALHQQIRIAYDAYPERIYGRYAAELVAISAVPVDPREYPLPPELREPVFLVRAVIAPVSPAADQMQRLRSGMQFSAEIVIAEQTLLTRVLSPLRQLGSRL